MNLVKNVLAAAALLLSANASQSAEQKISSPSAAPNLASAAVGGAKQTKVNAAPAVKVRLVDINSAGRNELKTLPGVSDAVADKIIAGRPFGSKAQLTTRGFLPRGTYENLKGLVAAKQDAGTTATLLRK